MKRYNKKINKSFYSVVKIGDKKEVKTLTQEEFENGEAGYILAPFVLSEHTQKSLDDYNSFMNNYKKEHELCPKCGDKDHMSTLMGFILDSDKQNEYKDLNRCTCANCGDVHTKHERVSVEMFKK